MEYHSGYNFQSRFQVRETPVASPGHCFTCRGHEGPFVDTGLSEPFYGAYILCRNCVKHMAEQFGLMEEIRVETTVDQATVFSDAFQESKNAVIALVANYVGGLSADLLADSSASVEDAERVAEDTGDSGSDDGGAVVSRKSSNESSRKQRRADVRETEPVVDLGQF